MKQPIPGEAVSFCDPWRLEGINGVMVDIRRSATKPWRVAIVRLHNGTEVEVHPDRLEPAGAKSA